MRAVVIDSFGGPEELKLRDVAAPECGDDEVLIALDFSGINYMDVYMRNGAYAKSNTYKTPLPMVLGMEGGGIISKVGRNVSRLAPGDRVAYCLSRGSYAEYAVVPQWRVMKVPDGLPLEIATASMLQGLTAHYLTHSIFPLSKDQWCLIHAGAGGVGQLAIQMAKIIGAKVITTVGSAQKAEIAKNCGADFVIPYKEIDFRDEVMRITGNRGVDVVYDSVGKDTISRSIHCLRRRGLCVMFGASSGQVPSITPLELAEAGSVYFTRPHLADYTATFEELDERVQTIYRYIASNRLHVPIHKIFSLNDVSNAHITLESRGTLGKMLINIKQ